MSLANDLAVLLLLTLMKHANSFFPSSLPARANTLRQFQIQFTSGREQGSCDACVAEISKPATQDSCFRRNDYVGRA